MVPIYTQYNVTPGHTLFQLYKAPSYTKTHTHTRVCYSVYVYLYIYSYTYIHVYIYIYLYIHMFMCIDVVYPCPQKVNEANTKR